MQHPFTVFRVKDAKAQQPRIRAFEISSWADLHNELTALSQHQVEKQTGHQIAVGDVTWTKVEDLHERTMLTVDLDRFVDGANITHCFKTLEAAGFGFYAHTTWSHSASNPCWRMFIPLAHAVAYADWTSSEQFKFLETYFPPAMFRAEGEGKHRKDKPSWEYAASYQRMNYVPPPGFGSYTSMGERVVDVVVKPVAACVVVSRPAAIDPTWAQHKFEAEFAKRLAEAQSCAKGSNDASFKGAFHLGGYAAHLGWDNDRTVLELAPLIDAWNRSSGARNGSKDFTADIVNGFTKGLASPITPPALSTDPRTRLQELGATFIPVMSKGRDAKPTGELLWSEAPANLSALLDYCWGDKITLEETYGVVVMDDLLKPAAKIAFNADLHLVQLINMIYDISGRQLMPELTNHLNMKNNQGWLIQCVEHVARRRSFSLFRQLIEPHKKQDDELLDTWLIKAMGAEDTPMNRLRARRFIIGTVARQLKPGSKFDTMLVLECVRGSGKSTAVKIFSLTQHFEQFGIVTYCEDDLAWDSGKEMGEKIGGKIVAEVPEMHRKGEASREAVKAALSKTIDTYRPAYARSTKSQPRTCVFIGTTEECDWHDDPKNGRRFWPVKCSGTESDRNERLAWFEDNVLRVYGAALHAYESGERWHFESDEMEANEIDMGKRLDHNEHALFDKALWDHCITSYDKWPDKVRISDILKHVVKNPRAGRNLSKQLKEYYEHTRKWRVTNTNNRPTVHVPREWFDEYAAEADPTRVEKMNSTAYTVSTLMKKNL